MLLGGAQHLTPYSEPIASALATASQGLVAALQQSAEAQQQPQPPQPPGAQPPHLPQGQRAALAIPNETVTVRSRCLKLVLP